MGVEEEYERLALPLAEKYVCAKMTDSTYAAMTSEVRMLEMALNERFYPEVYEVFLFLNEEDKQMQMGYREKPSPFQKNLVSPSLSGFKQLWPVPSSF